MKSDIIINHYSNHYLVLDHMQKSFLRVEDWAPIHSSITNPCWLEILRILDNFQQLIEAQKKEIIQCIKQLSNKRVDLVKLFSKYKSSLKYSGEIKKQVLNVYDNEKAKYFFSGYYNQIQEIVTKIGDNPSLLARIISKDFNKKIDNEDFIHSLLYHLYPCHLPSNIKSRQPNNCLIFVEEIINQWSYNVKLGRPSQYSVIDQIINGFNKTPQIVCYLEKISMFFMKQINKCKMDFFAFDEEAIKHECELKRSLALSQKVEKKSKWISFTSFFSKKDKEDTKESCLSVTSDASDPRDLQFDYSDIMKIRQRDLINAVKQTIKFILKQQTPFLLNKMMGFFHNKIESSIRQLQVSRAATKTVKANQQDLEKSSTGSQSNSLSNKQNKNQATVSIVEKELSRHYCYFLLTNLICQQLHNKFTLSHQDTGMRPADLQNITEIIKMITQVFQCNKPEGEKYKNQKLFKQFQQIIPKIYPFYSKIIEARNKKQEAPIQQPYLQQNEKIRQILLNLHQNTFILSFNDIRTLITIIKSSNCIGDLNLSKKSAQMDFLSDPKIKNLFQLTTKRVQFNEFKHEVQKIFFLFNSHRPSSREVIDFYTGIQSPLKQLPILTKALMYDSNLNVTEALEVTKSLQLMQNLSLKEIRYFIGKLALRYTHLYLKDTQVLSQKFKETLQRNLTSNIIRKSMLILHRDEICSRITFTEKIIQFYTQQLRSSQFYDRISEAFLHSIKIKVYLRIQNDELNIYQSTNEMKGINLQALLMTDNQTKQKKMSEEYILRNSFKSFSSIPDLLNTIIKSPITRLAVSSGRRVEQFNMMFTKMCSIILSYVQQFMKKREILQNLNKQKLAKTIIGKIQNHIFEKTRSINAIQLDINLSIAKQKIDKELFFQKDLKQYKIDWNFLFKESANKFNLMIDQASIQERIRHFNQLFKLVYITLGFSMGNNKITAQIINPVIQYLVLTSNTNNRHYECLFSLQTLRWNTTPETSYNITVYESSLTYISKMMHIDYPLKESQN